MANHVYTYYLLDENGDHKDQYTCYSDIAFEFGVTRNSIAGKFYRAQKKLKLVIDVNGNKIKKEVLKY